MNRTFVIGLLLGPAIGSGCRGLGIPSQAPPVLVGALLVLAMTAGYQLTDRLLRSDTLERLQGWLGSDSRKNF